MTHNETPSPAEGFDLGKSRDRMHENHTTMLQTADVAVSVQKVKKQFGDFTAVKDVVQAEHACTVRDFLETTQQFVADTLRWTVRGY